MRHVIKHYVKKNILFITFFFPLKQNVKVCWFSFFKLKMTSHLTSETCEFKDIRAVSDHWTLPTEVKGHLLSTLPAGTVSQPDPNVPSEKSVG